MELQHLKKSVYKEMSELTKALGNPNRLEIMDLLAQGSAPVEYIAEHTGLTVANTSQHLQSLKSAKLVDTERRGKYIYYQLANQQVFQTWCALRRLSMSQNAQINQMIDEFRQSDATVSTISAEELIRRMENEEVMLIDVRPEDEYQKGHIQNADSMPIDRFYENLKSFDKKKPIVVYCRGPFCMLADEAIQMLNQKGYKALRLENGYPDWEARGLPVENE
jgi:rhodanese-related sulfurtransferase